MGVLSRETKGAAIFGLLHFLMDFACVYVVASFVYDSSSFTGDGSLFTFEAMVFYNVAAFALQFPFGIFADKVHNKVGLCTIAFAVLFLCLWVADITNVDNILVPFMVMVGVANALFHASAGGWVLDRTDDKLSRFGLFLAPGALGVLFGMILASSSFYFLRIVVLIAILYCIKATFNDKPFFGEHHRVINAVLLAVTSGAIIVFSFGLVEQAVDFPVIGNWVFSIEVTYDVVGKVSLVIIALLANLLLFLPVSFTRLPRAKSNVVRMLNTPLVLSIVCFCVAGFIRSFAGYAISGMEGFATQGAFGELSGTVDTLSWPIMDVSEDGTYHDYGMKMRILPSSVGFVVACTALLAFAGKLIGGFFAERTRLILFAIASPVIVIPVLIFLGKTGFGLLGIVLLNMPAVLTTCVLSDCLPRHRNALFGLMSLMLVLGALPFFGGMHLKDFFGSDVVGNVVLYGLLLLSTVSLCVGIALLRRAESGK